MSAVTVFFSKTFQLDFLELSEKLKKFFDKYPLTVRGTQITISLPNTSLYVHHSTEDFVAEEAIEIAGWYQNKLTLEQFELVYNSNHRVEIHLEDRTQIGDYFNEWLICAEIVSGMGPCVCIQMELSEVWDL